MKSFRMFFLVSICVLANFSSAYGSRSKILAAAQHVNQVTIFVASPYVLNNEEPLDVRVKSIVDSPEIKVTTSDLQRITNVVEDFSDDNKNQCSVGSSYIDAVVRIEMNDGQVVDYVTGKNMMFDPRSGRCYTQPSWVTRVLSL